MLRGSGRSPRLLTRHVYVTRGYGRSARGIPPAERPQASLSGSPGVAGPVVAADREGEVQVGTGPEAEHHDPVVLLLGALQRAPARPDVRRPAPALPAQPAVERVGARGQ